MFSFLSPDRLAMLAVRRPWTVIGAWVAVLAVAMVLASQIGNSLTTDFRVQTDLEAQTGEQLIDEHFDVSAAPDEYVLIQSDRYTVDSPEFRAVVEALLGGINSHSEQVSMVVNYYETGDESLVAADRGTLLVPVFLTGEVLDLHETVAPVIEELEKVNGLDGFLAATGGRGSIDRTWIETSESDLKMAELIGLPIALLVLVFVFGALVAAGLPILLALGGILTAVGLTAIVGMRFDLSVFVMNMISMIGLAVGIDYSLLVIQRFREERLNGLSRDEAIEKAGSTASRAVLFSGLAVVVALSGMLFVPDNIFRSLSVGAIFVVFAAVSAALTLLPAILRLLGDRVNVGTLPGRRIDTGVEGGAFWSRAVRLVMGKPIVSATLAVSLLVALALPYFGMKNGQSGAATLPDGSLPAAAFRILDEKFNAGVLSPTEIIVRGDLDDPVVAVGIGKLRALLTAEGIFTEPTVTGSRDGALTWISTGIQGDSQADEAFAALARLRDEHLPEAFGERQTYVTGQTAWSQDYSDLMGKYTPIVFAFVLGLSFIILLVVFRSIVVPIKAILLNLLSVGAAYGVMVLVFQHGLGAGLLGMTQVERIENWVPLMMFAILFGLSMDYHVFLLTRIRERYDHTHDNAGSVAYGVRATAGLITGAAAIMIAVFSGFAMGNLVMMQQFGLGLGVAILLDATVIRVVLVPASMVLLGDANWYLPRWLEWLPKVDVEGTQQVVEPRLAPARGEAIESAAR